MDEANETKGKLRNFFFAVFGAMFVLSILVFGESIRHGFSMLDDRFLVLGNYYIRGFTLENIIHVFTHYDPELYIPLTFVSYQLTYLLSELNPAGYHLGNILLHAANAALVTVIAKQISGKVWTSLAAGILFCLHPINTEAVVWIAGRKDLLSTFFALLTVTFWIEHRTKEDNKFALLSAIALMAGLLSKASVMTIPLVLLLIDFCIEERPVRRSVFVEKIPHLALAVLFAVVAMFGKTRVVGSSTLLETLLMAPKSAVFYLQKLLLPIGLTPLYPWNGPIEASDPTFFVPLLVIATIIIASVIFLQKQKALSGALLMFFVLLSPTFLNFHKGDSMFFAVDRYAYMPSVPLMIAVCFLVNAAYERLRIRNASIVAAICSITVFAVLGSLAYLQTKTWATDISVMERAVRLYPHSVPGRVSLAAAYREAGYQEFEKKVLEDGKKTGVQHVAYHTALGSVYTREGRGEEARSEYQKAMALDPKSPEPYFYLGSLLEEQGKASEALEAYRKAIELDESYVAAYNNAGGILRDQKDTKGAEEMFRSAISWNPSFWEVEYNLFEILETTKRSDEAFPHLVKSYELSNRNTEIARALAYQYSVRNKKKDALAVIQDALIDSPEDRSLLRLKSSLESGR